MTSSPCRSPGLMLIRAAALILLLAGCSGHPAGSWDPAAAARYLDGRASAWLHWRTASRDRGTVCISCHTSLPYLLARDELRPLLHETQLPGPERTLLAMVRKRAGLWPHVLPWYGGDEKLLSRGTEPVINALILVHEEAGHGPLTPLTRKALADMWAEQRTSGPDAGSWPWIEFNNEPWEAPDSTFYGATLAARAVGLTPDSYRQDPAVAAKVALLRDYLRRAGPRQTLLNRIQLLWAAAALPGLIEPAMRSSILGEIAARQGADGGWNLAALMPGWKRHDGSPQAAGSDGYATAFVTDVLEESGVPATDPGVRRALAWLQGHQSAWNGRWESVSPNRRNGWLPHQGDHFMDDAATAFAVQALIHARGAALLARASSQPAL